MSFGGILFFASNYLESKKDSLRLSIFIAVVRLNFEK
jgi:hypothetical protein